MRIKFVCEYNGKNFHGFQRQSKLRSVQGVLEDALEKYFKQKVVINGSGRTDVGVHAREQVCTFDIENHYILCSICDEQQNIWHRAVMGVNAFLAENKDFDVSVRDFEAMADDFHARFSAKEKTYLYRVYVSKNPSPLREDFYHQIYEMPNIKAMQDVADKHFIGIHDFKDYCGKIYEEERTTIRTITRFDVEQRGDELWFWVTGDGFLYKQVRLMVGQLLYGKRQTVPAKGLTLWQVLY